MIDSPTLLAGTAFSMTTPHCVSFRLLGECSDESHDVVNLLVR